MKVGLGPAAHPGTPQGAPSGLRAAVCRAEDEVGEGHNPYLAGVFAPVIDEVDAAGLEVIGEIPLDLEGVFIRNGPNPRFPPRGRYHWFDGDGMVHAVRFHRGGASYRNRWVRTRGLARDVDAGHALWSGVMESVGANPADLPLKDTANTDVVLHDGRVLALWYLCGEPYALDPLNLETTGPEGLAGRYPRRLSAHAKVDPISGELFWFDYGPRPPYLRYGVVAPAGGVVHEVSIDLPGPRLPHDMAITVNHAIVMDLPLVNDVEAAHRGRHKIVFDPSLPARFGVIPRRGTSDQLRWFEASPCYIYHVVNAWEDGADIILDVCRVDRPAPPDEARGPLGKMLSYLRLDAQLYRYRFNLATGATHEEQRGDDNAEFPTINLGRLGRASRYAYTAHISPEPSLLFDGIIRYDTTAGVSAAHWFGPGRWGSEAPFAARLGTSVDGPEDDGYLVSFVHDEAANRSEVVILDASDVAAGPVGRVLLPGRVPIGFHSCWVPAGF